MSAVKTIKSKNLTKAQREDYRDQLYAYAVILGGKYDFYLVSGKVEFVKTPPPGALRIV